MGAGPLLLLASACGFGFEVLDTTDSEWVAPGYEVVEEAVIDPLEYGEPIQSWGTRTRISCQAFFVDRDGQECWRVIAVLRDKLVVFEKDRDPVEYRLSLETRGACFSPEGQYVVVRSINDDADAEFFDIDSGTSRIFHPSPDGSLVQMFLRDDGSLIAITSHTVISFDDNLVPCVHEYPGSAFRWPTRSVSGNLLVVENATEGPRSIVAFWRDGKKVWEFRSGDYTQIAEGGISFDDRIVVLPCINRDPSDNSVADWTMCLDGSTGELLWTDPERIVGRPLPSATEPSTLINGLFDSQAISTISRIDSSSIGPVISPCFSETWNNAFLWDTDGLLALTKKSEQWVWRFVIISPDGSCAWASEAIDTSHPTLVVDNYDTLNYSVALSSNANCVVYNDGELIRVSTILFRGGE